MSKTKLKKIAFPRQIAMYLCRELTEHTYPHIGAAFNDRDHTTVMYAVNKISKEVKKDESLRKAVEQIKNSIIYEIMYRGYMFKLVGDENLYQNQEIKDLIVYLKSLEQYM